MDGGLIGFEAFSRVQTCHPYCCNICVYMIPKRERGSLKILTGKTSQTGQQMRIFLDFKLRSHTTISIDTGQTGLIGSLLTDRLVSRTKCEGFSCRPTETRRKPK